MLRLPHGKDVVLDFQLITAGGSEFLATVPASVAAGDAKVMHNRLAPANIGGQTVSFTSGGTYEIKPGDTITGATSSQTAIVMGVRLTSGTFAGADAAGVLFLRNASGAFQAENLDVGANANVATIAGDLDAAGLFVYLTGKRFALGVPGSQLEGARGVIDIIDQTATELWEDTTIPFETYGHPRAADPDGVLFKGTATSVTANTLVVENLDDGFVRHLSADANSVANQWIYIASATTGAGQAVPISSYVHGTRTYTLLYNWPLTPTGTIVYEIYSMARMPAHVIDAAAVETELDDRLLTAASMVKAEELASLAIVGTVGAGAHTATRIVASDATGHGNDRFIGRPLTFASGTLAGTTVKITDYVSATGLIDFTLITDAPAPAAPAENDTFVIH